MRRRVTFSRNVTLSLSRTCVSHCKYCAFATHQPHLHEPEEVERTIDRAARRRVKELLVLTGEAPDHLPAVRERLAELGVGDAGSLTYDSNFADSSQVTAERGEAEAEVATLRDRLEEVEQALSKLDTGSYGMCEGCGNPIDSARLEALPSARFCISCASKR